MGLNLAHGGHLTHGMKHQLLRQALQRRPVPGPRRRTTGSTWPRSSAWPWSTSPQLIVAGWSAYARQLDFAEFRRIADPVGAYLMVDMAHFAGLVAAGLHPTPVPYAHVVTTTTHKTLGGPRGGVILTNDADIAKKINSAVFPGQQGGPLEHVIAGKAVAFKIAASPEFKERQERVLAGARILAERLLQPDVAANGHHRDHRRHRRAPGPGGPARLASSTASRPRTACAAIDITVNRNAVPFDPRPPMVTSGLRIGTPALATRGFGEAAFAEVADIIAEALIAERPAARSGTGGASLSDDAAVELRARVTALADSSPSTRIFPNDGTQIAAFESDMIGAAQ